MGCAASHRGSRQDLRGLSGLPVVPRGSPATSDIGTGSPGDPTNSPGRQSLDQPTAELVERLLQDSFAANDSSGGGAPGRQHPSHPGPSPLNPSSSAGSQSPPQPGGGQPGSHQRHPAAAAAATMAGDEPSRSAGSSMGIPIPSAQSAEHSYSADLQPGPALSPPASGRTTTRQRSNLGRPPSSGPSPRGGEHDASDPQQTRPVSASSNASSRPSSAASRPPRSPSGFTKLMDLKACPDIQTVRNRRSSNDFDSPRHTPRSPVTLLPHSPVARTPRSPLPSGGVALCGVPQLPLHYVERSAELAECRHLLVAGSHVVVAGFEGIGGVGKSTLAAAVARDEEVQWRFKDGVFWIMLGPKVNPMIKAEGLKVTMSMLRKQLPIWAPLEETNTLESMREWFSRMLSGRRCMLVVDNCSDAAALEAFEGTGFTLLVTTRNMHLAEEIGAHRCTVPLALGDLAPKILNAAAGTAEGMISRDVLQRYGGLPLELGLVGGALKDLPSASQAGVLAKLAESQLNVEELYGKAAAAAMEPATAQLLRTITSALDLLPPVLQLCFKKLVVLPDGVYTPLHMLQLLWGLQTEGEVRDVCRQLASRSLLVITNSDDGGENITVHDVQLDFLRHNQKSDTEAWHSALLDAYSRGLDHIAAVTDDGYVVSNIAHHLKGSHRLDTLRELLYDTDWLERKLHNHGVRAVMDDFRRYLEDRKDPQVHTLGRAFRMAAPAALAHPQLSMLGVQMAARLMAHRDQPLIPDWIEFIRALLDEEMYSQGALPLWPLTPSLGQVEGGQLATLTGHTSWVTSVAVSPDSAWAATSSTDRTARLWDLATGKVLHVLNGHEDHVTALAVTPCSTRLVTASRDKTSRVWDIATGKQLAEMKGHTGGINCCAVVAGPSKPKVVTAADDRTARVWSLEDGALLCTLSGHMDKVRAVAVTRAGGLAITASDDATSRVWDLKSGDCCHVLSHSDKVGGAVVREGHGARGSVLTLSSDATARLWDLSNGVCLHVLRGHKSAVGSAAITRDGKTAVTVSGDKTARVWALDTGACVHELRGHTNWVNGVSICPGGGRAITVSVDRHARIWDLKTGRCITTLQGHKSLVADVAVTEDSSKAVTISSDMTVKLWSLVDGLSVYGCGHSAPPAASSSGSVSVAVAVLPDGERCVSAGADGKAHMWDCASGLSCRVGLEAPPGLPEGGFSAVAVSGDGGSVVAAAGDAAVMWDLGFLAQQPRLLHVLRGHTAPVHAVGLSRQGDAAVTAGADTTARVWDPATGECRQVLQGHTGPVVAVLLLSPPPQPPAALPAPGSGFTMPGAAPAPSPQQPQTPKLEAVVTASRDGTARVWDPDSGRCTAVLSGHTGELTCLVEAPAASSSSSSSSSSGTSEVVTASRDGTLRVWAAASKDGAYCSGSWAARLVLKGQGAPITAAAVVRSNHGASRLSSGSEDGRLLLWDLEAGTQLHTIEAHEGPVRCLSAGVCDEWDRPGRDHPAGPLLLSCGDDATVALWDTATACQVGLFRADRPMASGALSLAISRAGWASAIAGDVAGGLHFLQLPKR